jgi:hypothetical protein
MSIWETGSDGGRWNEICQDNIQWRALVLLVLKFGFCHNIKGNVVPVLN